MPLFFHDKKFLSVLMSVYSSIWALLIRGYA